MLKLFVVRCAYIQKIHGWTKVDLLFKERERERRKGGEDFEETMAAQRKYFMTQRGMDRDARD